MEKDKEHILIEDLWTKLFAFHLGAQCPNERAKEKFIYFVLSGRRGQEPLTEEFVFKQLPKFINYLAEI
tara:strand:+ start:2752 stop:2958 length:207 start_codon:yes stop_codon:yes gene_type:complete